MDIPDLDPNPIEQLRRWFAELAELAPDQPEPWAMVLATAGADARPRARNVLLRGFDDDGFVWFTNRNSVKGRHLAENPWGSLTFSWLSIRRQVIVCGGVAPTSDAESDAYWSTRERGSQLSAAASPQSDVIADRATLERAAAELARRHPDTVPRPAHWGGYRLRPDSIEFWVGRENRLHDRFRYARDGEGWRIDRLAP